jgi:hypothetical protein
MATLEPGRVRPGSSLNRSAGLNGSFNTAQSPPIGRPGTSSGRPGTSGGRPGTAGGPPVSSLGIGDGGGGGAPQLALLDDGAYFAVMQADILLLQRRLRAFATPRKGTEVSEASLSLIMGGSNPLQAKVALHELHADKAAQLERAIVLSTAPGLDEGPPPASPSSRLGNYLLVQDRLQRLHAHAAEGGSPFGDATHAGGGGGDGGKQVDELRARVQERDRLNATLERELMELQSAMRVQESKLERRVEAARAEAAAVAAGSDSAGGTEKDVEMQLSAFRDAAARSADAASAAAQRASELETETEQLRASVASLEAKADGSTKLARALAREDDATAALAAAEASLQAKEATIAGLKRALSELEATRASPAAPAGADARISQLEAELGAAQMAARNSTNYLQARVDQLLAQLGGADVDEAADKSMVAHMGLENERLQVRARARFAARAPCAHVYGSHARDGPT